MASTASGNFTKTPFPQVLVFVLRRGMTGTLVISSPAGDEIGMLYFKEGRPAAARIEGASERLGELLMIRGLINAKTLAAALRHVKDSGEPLGKFLVENGDVDASALEDVLRFQLERRLTGFYGLGDETFVFHPGENLAGIPDDCTVTVHPLASMPRGLREHWKPERLEEQLGRVAGQRLKLSGELEKEPAWSDEESAIAKQIRGRPLSLDQMVTLSAGQETSTLIVIYVHLLAGAMELLGEASIPPPAPDRQAAPVPAPPPPKPVQSSREASQPEPEKPDPRIAALRDEAREKIEQIGSGDHFVLLEVARDDDAERIRSSYMQLVKKFHPDRAESVGDAQLKEDYLFISTKLREAFDILTDDEKRKKHLVKLGGGPTESEEEAIVQKTLDAEFSFQKAGILARKKKWDDVVELMQPVVQSNPENGEYLALLSWARVQVADPSQPLARWETELRKATEMAPRSEKAAYYLAQVLKRSGKDREARRFLQNVVSINPHHIEAKRELHIMNRRDAQKKSRIGGGLLGGSKQSDSDRTSKPPDEADGGGALGKLKKILTKKL